MALKDRKPISTKPGGPYADRGTPTEYSASRGGWYPAENKPVPGTPRNGKPREAR
ncbi:hypothetical protein RI578_40455 (plasmid) [Streptomyces sp. BB1-1-1]|uniref:hypothetical protein n=1 Tax=Streptomyces sp. BB1-1-1 TaxID=3074430 RepID=UPI002877F126|nr:hypothetical protein [Streptomyces sp. BB1-1-1]WND40565.1 hypothetical protein RI578_40455 [Streptomyces sp. BB1-1-1]